MTDLYIFSVFFKLLGYPESLITTHYLFAWIHPSIQSKAKLSSLAVWNFLELSSFKPVSFDLWSTVGGTSKKCEINRCGGPNVIQFSYTYFLLSGIQLHLRVPVSLAHEDFMCDQTEHLWVDASPGGGKTANDSNRQDEFQTKQFGLCLSIFSCPSHL